MVIYIVDYEQSINEQITVPKHTWKANIFLLFFFL